MTFPRVHHADYFSDSGPVDGTVLVNSHSDAIEALQALGAYVGPVAGLPVPGTPGQIGIMTDQPGPSNFYQMVVWDAGDWQSLDASDYQARAVFGTFAAITATTTKIDGALAFASDQSDATYFWHAAAWHSIVDAVARSAAATAQTAANTAQSTANGAAADAGTALLLYPVFGVGTPTATSQPTDGTVVNYYDTTAATYVHYVFNPGVGAFHQVA